VVEHYIDTVGVTGSNPVSRTIQNKDGALSQARYMSSNEFAELRGINVAVSARATILLSASRRELIWFIQGLSLREGGLKRVARELVEMFSKRLCEGGVNFALRHKPDAINETGNYYDFG
jgi:hypothetical protein